MIYYRLAYLVIFISLLTSCWTLPSNHERSKFQLDVGTYIEVPSLMPIVGDFTVELIVNPGMRIQLDTSKFWNAFGEIQDHQFVLFPKVDSNTSSSIGLSIGTNGVLIILNDSNGIRPLQSVAIDIDSKANLVMVQNQAKLSLYLDSELAMSIDLKTEASLFPSFGRGMMKSNSFIGSWNNLRLWSRALEVNEFSGEKYSITGLEHQYILDFHFDTLKDEGVIIDHSGNANYGYILNRTPLFSFDDSYFTEEQIIVRFRGKAKLTQEKYSAPNGDLSIDKVQQTTLSTHIIGWARNEGYPSNDDTIVILLQGENKDYLLGTSVVQRDDLVEVFGNDYRGAGFEAFLDHNSMEPGTYEVALLLFVKDSLVSKMPLAGKVRVHDYVQHQDSIVQFVQYGPDSIRVYLSERKFKESKYQLIVDDGNFYPHDLELKKIPRTEITEKINYLSLSMNDLRPGLSDVWLHELNEDTSIIQLSSIIPRMLKLDDLLQISNEVITYTSVGTEISGWYVNSNRQASTDKLWIILKNANGIHYMLESDLLDRDDVSKAYGISYKDCGYRAFIPAYEIPIGSYQLGLTYYSREGILITNMSKEIIQLDYSY